MNKEDSLYSIYVQILKEELSDGYGTTEPIAISYACARNTQVLIIADHVIIKGKWQYYKKC